MKASSGRRYGIGLVAVLLAVSGLAGCSSVHKAVVAGKPGPAAPWPSASVQVQRRFVPPALDAVKQPNLMILPPGVSYVARLTHNEAGYASPSGPKVGEVAGSQYGIPAMLLVIGRTPGWLDVRLIPRPDGSTAWIRDDGVILSKTPYRIVVNVKTTHLELYKSNRLVMDVPAGVGTSVDPTPTGHYFVTYFVPPPNDYDDYGPFEISTSAHSKAILSWDGTGDAVIAIHGPIFAEDEIGTTGTYVSHGCVRILIPDLLKLESVPPGSPVDIVD